MITEQSKRCIVSFANERGRYMENLVRLKQSLVGKFDGDFLGFVGEDSIGAPPHLENPYAFKVYAIQAAIEVGYTSILWLDSSCYAVTNLAPIFDAMEQDGYIMQEAGHFVGTWTNDKTLEYFGITRDIAMDMPCYGNAGFLGLNFDFHIAQEFFRQWNNSMEAGMFKGEWSNDGRSESSDERCKGHRHDLSCGSIIANKLGMKYKKGDEWLQYGAPEDPKNNNTILIKAQG